MIKNRYAITYFTVDDVKDYAPDWTRRQCAEFLDRWEEELMDVMAGVAWSLIEDKIQEERQ